MQSTEDHSLKSLDETHRNGEADEEYIKYLLGVMRFIVAASIRIKIEHISFVVTKSLRHFRFS